MNSAQEEMDLLDGCVSMRLHQMGLEELPLGSRFNADLNPILLAALAIENVIPLLNGQPVAIPLH